MMGYGDEGTLALSARLRYARRTRPFKTGRTTCTPLTGSVWRTTPRYRGKVRGEPPGPPSTIRIPHIKGTTPDRDVTPSRSLPGASKKARARRKARLHRQRVTSPDRLHR